MTKKERDHLFNEVKELGRLNDKAIDLNCDIYMMLEETLGVNFYEDNKNIADALHEQWYDVLHRQERIINALLNDILLEDVEREHLKDEQL